MRVFDPGGAFGDNPQNGLPSLVGTSASQPGGGAALPLPGLPGRFSAATASLSGTGTAGGQVALTGLACVCAPGADGLTTDVVVLLSSDQFARLAAGAVGGLVFPAPGRVLDPGGAFGDDPQNGPPALPGAALAPIPFSEMLIAPGLPDLDWQVGFLVVDLGAGTRVLSLGSCPWVHAPVAASDVVTGNPYDLSGLSFQMALYDWLNADGPAESDWQACDLIVRTAAPAGTFLRAWFDATALGLARASYRGKIRVAFGAATLLLDVQGTLSAR